MRNTLRDLYERQVRHHRPHVYDLDLPITQFTTAPEARIQQVPSPNVLTDQAAALESSERLGQAMSGLSPRLRLVAEGIRDGKSYTESVSPSASPNKPLTSSPELPSPRFVRNSKPWASKASTLSAFLKVAVASRLQPNPPQVDDFPPQP